MIFILFNELFYNIFFKFFKLSILLLFKLLLYIFVDLNNVLSLFHF
jgi:hypothetical protein